MRLLQRLRSGDERALTAIFDLHAPAVTRYAWALAAHRSDAEEIVQDTFVSLWRSAPRIRLFSPSLLPWLLVTCRNHGSNARRKRARQGTIELAEGTRAAALDTEAPDSFRWVRSEIAKLDPIDQRVCELCLIEGRSYREVAKLLGTSEGAIKQRVFRTRSRLRKAVLQNEE
jgi:RNA polymerase sigma factor (sigma-70 family)